jgi:hypothetical protein
MYYFMEYRKLFLLSKPINVQHAVTNLLGPSHWLEASFCAGVGTMLSS